MKPESKDYDPTSCVGCKVWLPMEQTGVPTQEKIKACIRHVLGKERLWLTGEEFLAQVEAQKRAHDEARLNPKPVDPTQGAVRDYFLKPFFIYAPKKRVAKTQEVSA